MAGAIVVLIIKNFVLLNARRILVTKLVKHLIPIFGAPNNFKLPIQLINVGLRTSIFFIVHQNDRDVSTHVYLIVDVLYENAITLDICVSKFGQKA